MRRLIGAPMPAVSPAAALVAAVLVAGALVGACGSGKSPIEIVTEAPARTTQTDTARISEVIDITSRAAPDVSVSTTEVTGEGAMDFGNRRAELTVHVGDQSLDVVVSGTTIYEHIPELAEEYSGKEWLKLDFDTLGKVAGIEGLDSLAQSQPNDPAAALDYLRGAAGPIEEIGHERVRGVDTTRYRATVDINKAAAAAPPAARATVRQISDAFGIVTIPVEAWIDEDGRVRRISQTVDYSAAKGTPEVPADSLPERVKATLEFYDFGRSVTADVPPSDEVVDFGEFLARLNTGSGTQTPATRVLEGRLITDVPLGYLRQPDGVGDAGPSDLEKAVRDDGGEDARQVLVADGFVAGYQRSWAKPDDALVIDFLFEFRAPDGAMDYLVRLTNGALDSEPGLARFDVAGIPDARGFRGTSEGARVAVVYFTRGPFLAQVVVVGPDADGSTVVDLADQQYRRLS